MRRIYEALLAQSPQIRDGNFRLIGTDDLERLFVWYDREFFRGRLGEMLMEDEAYPVTFRLSRRLVERGRPDDPLGPPGQRQQKRPSPKSTTRSRSRPRCSTTRFTMSIAR